MAGTALNLLAAEERALVCLEFCEGVSQPSIDVRWYVVACAPVIQRRYMTLSLSGCLLEQKSPSTDPLPPLDLFAQAQLTSRTRTLKP